MKPPETRPAAVTAGVERYARQHAEDAAALLAELRWDGIMGCYWFRRGGMFHGVELDGHVHT